MKFTKYALATVLSLGTLAGTGVAAFAAESEDYTSGSKIEFIASEDVTSPIDPGNPDEGEEGGDIVTPVDPTDPDGPNPGTSGPLSIDFASSLDFGQNKISSKNETYYANPQILVNSEGKKITRANYVQVTDNRGTNAGWTLQVKQEGEFTATEDTLNDTLVGAQISFENSTVVTNMDNKEGVTVENVTLTPGQASTIMTAETNSGAGTWIDLFGSLEDVDGVEKNTGVKLFVPGSTAKDAVEYRTELTWTLTDVPGNEDVSGDLN